jgi:hypothetical protein
MVTMRSKFVVLLTGLLAGCWGDGGPHLYGTPGCIEFSCLWQTEAGSIEEVGSWHKAAKAYRLVGTPARITRKVDASLPVCMEIDLTANVARDAQLELQLDFGDDGSIDSRVQVGPGEWTRRLYYVRTPLSARHLRTYIAKQGPGEAAIEHIALQRGEGECAALPPTTLADGSTCLDDASCTSGYCVLGKCSPCGAGGCAEGTSCRADKDCNGGACAAGVCRACAATGSCGAGEGCSADTQCAAGTCVFGGKPSLVHYPELDGVCGECNADADCASGKCANGECADCATDADCSGGLRCRYADLFETGARSCVPRFDGILPRGALCEVDAECAAPLRCGGPPGRLKRCGLSCRTSADCAARETCGDAGSIPSKQAGNYELLASYASESALRVRTCYPLWSYQGEDCQVHAQCARSQGAEDPNELNVCCGSCRAYDLDLASGACTGGDLTFTFFR